MAESRSRDLETRGDLVCRRVAHWVGIWRHRFGGGIWVAVLVGRPDFTVLMRGSGLADLAGGSDFAVLVGESGCAVLIPESERQSLVLQESAYLYYCQFYFSRLQTYFRHQSYSFRVFPDYVRGEKPYTLKGGVSSSRTAC